MRGARPRSHPDVQPHRSLLVPTQHRPLLHKRYRAQARLPSPWSTREDMITARARFHVTFKMLKRQMFGRAKTDLLRKRILLSQ